MPTKGQVHKVFNDRTGELATHAAQNAQAARGQGQRTWARPGGDWSGDPLDIAGLVDAYDRGAIDENYAGLLASGSDPGTAGDAISLKTQADYVALQERALRTRYASSVRCLAHAAARWRGHGHAKGIFHDGVIRYAQDAIAAGGS
jgi:hypothetical protein